MRNISIDIRKQKGKLDRYFAKCIGAGRAAEIMRHDAYEQLKLIQKECPFEYIRFHGLFHDEMGIVNRGEDGKLFFNFQYVDMLFDSLLEIGIRPVLELGLIPGELRSGDTTVFWWKMYNTPPKDYNEWGQTVETLVRHVTDRYGKEEIDKWFFEVWNEPDLDSFFRSDDRMNEYFKIYESAARAVKRVDGDYKVGGPATAGLRWIPDFISFCHGNDVPLDFISGHYYCLKGDFDADGKVRLVMNNHGYLSGMINKTAKECHAEGYPLLITEWSSSYSSRDPVHDTYFSAPFVLQIIKECEGGADMLSYWTYTDIFEEVGIGQTPFHGGFGLFNIQSLKKPVYHSYRMLNDLGDDELICDDRCAYACRKEDEIELLFWNSVILKQDVPNVEYFKRSLPAKVLEDATVAVAGLEGGKEYSVIVESIGYRMGDVYNAYLDGNFTDTPKREDVARLHEASKPKQTALKVRANDEGVLEFVLPQSENQVDFVRISL